MVDVSYIPGEMKIEKENSVAKLKESLVILKERKEELLKVKQEYLELLDKVDKDVQKVDNMIISAKGYSNLLK